MIMQRCFVMQTCYEASFLLRFSDFSLMFASLCHFLAVTHLIIFLCPKVCTKEIYIYTMFLTIHFTNIELFFLHVTNIYCIIRKF